jgi:hypothetical protein
MSAAAFVAAVGFFLFLIVFVNKRATTGRWWPLSIFVALAASR